MKIVTIGMSPFHLSARGKINSWILQYLYAKNHSVTSLVSNFDVNYFPPDEAGKFWYKFTNSNVEHKIQILPFVKNEKSTIVIYEELERLQPDVVVAIGDLSEFWFLRAIRTFSNIPFKTVLIATGYSIPIQTEFVEILDELDAVICVNKGIRDEFIDRGYDKLIEQHYVGCNQKVYCKTNTENSQIRISTICKNNQVDNLPVILQSFKTISLDIQSIYIHINRHDTGDYDINELVARFEVDENKIAYPARYICDNDGLSDKELSLELSKSEIFVSTHIVSSTGMSIFQALSCGCWPIMPNYGVYKEIAQEISNFSHKEINPDWMLISGLEFVSAGGSSIFIVDKNDLSNKILNYVQNRQKYKGLLNRTIECLSIYDNGRFLGKVLEVIDFVANQKSVLSLETI